MSLASLPVGKYNSDTENVPQVAIGTGTGGSNVGIGAFLWGSTLDGTCLLDGINTFTWATLVGSTYTLTRNVHATTLTVNNTITLKGGSFAIYCSVALAGSGVIDSSGGAASGATQGTAGGAGASFLGVGSAGGAGVVGVSVGASASLTNIGGGIGGVGGISGGGQAAGGVGGETLVSDPNSGGTNGLYAFSVAFLQGKILTGSATQQLNGGGGGSSGGAAATSTSGAGGGGGGVLLIFAKTITFTGTISLTGGNGGNASGSNAGGGGGGAGGFLGVSTTTTNYQTLCTVTVVGGSGGAKVGTGVAGSGGAVGLKLSYYFGS